MVKFSKFCSESFYRLTERHIVFNFREIWPTGNGEIMCWLPDRKRKTFAWLSSYRYCTDHTQNLPGPAPDSVLRML